MIKSILVPTDFSKEAESALKVAAQIAKKTNAKINLLHIIDLPVYQPDLVTSGTNESTPEALFFMEQTNQRIKETLSQSFLEGIDIQEKVSFESVTDGIINMSEENNNDIIIMGSHGTTGFEEIFIGSNAEKVVRTSKKPVLVIKEECDIFNINDLVYATSFEESNKPCLKAAGDFAALIEAKLHLLWINTPSGFKTTYQIEHKMNKTIGDLPIRNYTLNIYNDNSVEKGILNFANSINAGMIGISTHGRKGISHFFNGSLGEDVVNHAKRPVLTFKI